MTRDGYFTVEGLVMLAMGATVAAYAAWCRWSARRAKRSDCRHCGEPIRSDDGIHWQHGHGLIRCQTPGRPYGYDALPPADGPCSCWACERFGQTSPADNTGPSAQ